MANEFVWVLGGLERVVFMGRWLQTVVVWIPVRPLQCVFGLLFKFSGAAIWVRPRGT